MFVPKSTVCIGKPLPRTTPESVGVSSQHVLDFVDDAKKRGIHVHSFMMMRHDKVFAESYYAPYAPDQLQTVYSLSKSFTSVAIGIAQSEGILSLDERIVDIFADELKQEPCEQLAALTLRHCLTMSTGQPEELPDVDMIQAFLNMPFGDMPGEKFRYNTMATYMLSATLKRKGVDLEEYLQEKLFDPMGVSGLHWMRCSRGIPTGGYGLSIVPEVIAKFGLLLKNGGVWEGKRLIPQDYLDLATTKRIDNAQGNQGEWTHGYGYQFWMCRYDTFRGDGAFGQLCVVTKNKDAVLAMTAYTADIQAELDVYFEQILLKMQDDALPENPELYAQLQSVLGEQNCYMMPVADEGLAVPDQLLGRTLSTPDGVEMRLDLCGDKLKMHLNLWGDLELVRGGFCDQIAVCNCMPLSFPSCRIESRALAGYGVTQDGLNLRIMLVELLTDWLITLEPCADGIKVRATDVHLENEPSILYEGMIQ